MSGPTGFVIVRADYPADLARLRAVREPVFVIEQAVPIELEWDDLDPLSEHALALDEGGRPIGAARLTPERMIGRMAVLGGWRGRGVGAALLEHLLRRAAELGHPAVALHAQVHAIGFYARYGFRPEGPEFDDAGIAHRLMRRLLP